MTRHIIRTIGLMALITCLLAPLKTRADGDVMRSFTLDPVNTVVLRYMVKRLPIKAIPPPDKPLPPGAHWGGPIEQEEQTYDIVLAKNKSETVLKSVQFDVPAGMIIGTYTSALFTFIGCVLNGDTVHCGYVFQNRAYVLTLKKTGDSFQETKETSVPCTSDMGLPQFDESPEKTLLLRFRMSHSVFQENATGELVEQKAR